MAMTFHEWMRHNSGGTHDQYESYLGRLAWRAREANTVPGTPEAVIAQVFREFDESLMTVAEAAVTVLVALHEAGFEVTSAMSEEVPS
jgi:phosphoserine phosphatase